MLRLNDEDAVMETTGTPGRNKTDFNAVFEEFNRICVLSGAPFESFSAGRPGNLISDNLTLRATALERLNSNSWQTENFGTGRILEAVISSIEIPTTG